MVSEVLLTNAVAAHLNSCEPITTLPLFTRHPFRLLKFCCVPAALHRSPRGTDEYCEGDGLYGVDEYDPAGLINDCELP